MSLLDKSKAGLVLVLALFLFACESENIISLPLDTDSETIHAHYQEITLPFRLVQLDSINTTNRTRVLVGNYQNDTFGKVSAVGYTSFSITGRSAITAEDAFDSLSLIVVNDYYYGDREAVAPQTFTIHRLDTLPRKNQYTQNSYPYRPQSLGSLTFMPDTEAASSNDTLRIRLADALGQDLFVKARDKNAVMSTDSAFQDYFEGIAFVPQGSNEFMTGYDPARMRMVLYYSSPDDTASSTYTFGVGSTVTFNHIAYDRSGTAVAGINAPRETGQAADSGFYLQSGTGLSPVVNFQPLKDFVSNIKNGEQPRHVLLNRVDLYIGLSEADAGTQPPPVIRGYYFDENYDRVITNNNFQGLFADLSSLAPAEIPADSTFRYQKKVTDYMQFLVDEDTLARTEVLLLSDNFETTINQIATKPDSVKLKVYYTILE